MLQPFSALGDNATIAASVTSASATLPQRDASIALMQGKTLRVYNAAANPAFFRVGVGTQTAVLTDTFVAPGATEMFSLPPNADTIGVILSAGTGNVYAQLGDGT
jgi:hypothetical protein